MTQSRLQSCSRACVVGAASFGLLIAVCCLTAEASDSTRQLLEQAARHVTGRLSQLSMVSAGAPPGLTAFDFQVHSLSFAHSILRTRCLSSALFVSFFFTRSPFAITHTRITPPALYAFPFSFPPSRSLSLSLFSLSFFLSLLREPRTLSRSLSISLSLSVPLALSRLLPLFRYLSLSLALSLFLARFLSRSLSLAPSLSFFLFLSPSL